MVTNLMFKWYELLHYKEIPAIYWMTLVYLLYSTITNVYTYYHLQWMVYTNTGDIVI